MPSIFTNLVLPFLLCFQHISLSPDRKLALVVGDSTYGLVVDDISGQVSKTKYSISLLISSSQCIVISCLFVSCRQSTLSVATRISPSHRHGTQITKHSPLEAKTGHEESGTSGTSPNQLLFCVGTWQPFGASATHLMGSSWQCRKVQISSTSLTS
jgi:hypothetical protein